MNANRIVSAESSRGTTVVARILPGTDLVDGIETICSRHDISSGIVVSGIGSLQRTSFVYVVPDADVPVGAAYVPPRNIPGPIELLSLQGTIGLNGNNDACAHLHATMAGPDGRVFGGHLMASQNPVLATAEIMICATPDISLVKSFDYETGFKVFNPIFDN